jgi:hypothetical protein
VVTFGPYGVATTDAVEEAVKLVTASQKVSGLPHEGLRVGNRVDPLLAGQLIDGPVRQTRLLESFESTRGTK